MKSNVFTIATKDMSQDGFLIGFYNGFTMTIDWNYTIFIYKTKTLWLTHSTHVPTVTAQAKDVLFYGAATAVKFFAKLVHCMMTKFYGQKNYARVVKKIRFQL